MRKLFVVALIFTVFFSGTYWYYSGASLCRYPVAYSIGEFDEQFSITRAEARVAIHDAETVWEEAVGENLFNYDEDASFTINFIFDDRQALSEEQRAARDRLEAIEAENADIGEQYARLSEEYETLQKQHRAAVASYEARLAEHNAEVERYNAAGGVPPDEFERLQTERAELTASAEAIDNRAATLNEMASSINQLSAAGNELIEQYNERVSAYNERFSEAREFTQGDYQGNLINIYTFVDALELRQVLAHELGHALALGHVDDPQAIMYYMLGTQPDELTLTEADTAEFARVCADGPTLRGFISHLLQR